MTYAMPEQHHVVYQADPSHTETIKEVRERLWNVCGGLMHRRIRVKTIDGHEYEGIVVYVDSSHIHLSVAQNRGELRAFFPPYAPLPYYPGSTILPLVLFNLLAITLLYT